jgi:hypothetical protein
MHIPPLPYRPDSGGVYFPTGTWSAMFAACELRYAQELGVDVEPHHGVAYTAERPFDDFVKRVYKLKTDAKAAGLTAIAAFCKLVLNGGYGKFGMGPELETLHVLGTIEEAVAFVRRYKLGTVRPLTPARNGPSRFLSRTRFQWPTQTHYGIASYITGYSRIAVHRALVAAKNPVYCDTDSVHAEALGPPVRIGKGLGEWEPKLQRFRGEYFAPKLYRLQDAAGALHFAAKGFPLPRKEEEEDIAEYVARQESDQKRAEAFERAVAGEDVHLEVMASLKTQLGKFDGRFTRQGGKRAAAILRHWQGHSTKRRPVAGGATVPWDVDELNSGEHQKAVSPLGQRAQDASLRRRGERHHGS